MKPATIARLGCLICLAGAAQADARMNWEVHTHISQTFQSGETRGYSSHCRDGQVVSASIALEEPIPATPTLFRPSRGFEIFENRKGAPGRWDFSVLRNGPAVSVRVTTSIMCFVGPVETFRYD